MVTDLSFNIIALDKASATFIRVAEQLDRVSDRLDKLDGKNVEVDVNVKTDKSKAALDSFDTRFKLIAAGIIAASPLAGAAILSGIGAGFIGVAALVEKNNADVQASFRNMSQAVVLSTKSATDQLVPQFVGAGNQISAEVQRLEPVMKQGFGSAGPVIVALTGAAIDFAHTAMPGVSSAMQNSLPVFAGVQTAAGTIGQAFGDSVATVGQHSHEYGTVVSSMGSITGSVVTGATSIVNDLGVAWAHNATELSGAVAGITGDLSGLASGVLPVLSAGLDVAATAVHVITDALGPLAPVLGFVAAAAGATWVAMKIAGLVSTGITALASGVVNLGGNMEVAAGKSAVFIAAQQGVAVESSVAATAVRASGTAVAEASIGFATAAETIAGPLGIALVAGTVLLGLFSGSEDRAKISTEDLKAANDTLTSALESSHGAFNQQVIDALKSDKAFKDLAEKTKGLGIPQQELIDALVQGGPKLDALRAKLEAVGKANAELQRRPMADTSAEAANNKAVDAAERQAKASRNAVDSLNAYSGAVAGSVASSGDAARSAADVANNLFKITTAGQTTSPAMDSAKDAAKRLGVPLGEVEAGFRNIIASGKGVATDMPAVASTFQTLTISVESAADAMVAHFAQVDRAVTSARSSVADASHSYTQSLTSIQNAEHSAAGAARSLADAKTGVATATKALATAQNAEKKAEDDLHTARQRAVQDLKDLHAQLEDQVVTEESARVRLFESKQNAVGFGITDKNVKAIASQTVDDTNIDTVKAAIDLESAQNGLNTALSNGTKLRDQVAKADIAGVEGSQGVVAAQHALVSAQDQVVSSKQGVIKAQQQVSDAAWAEARAHDAVRDAQYQSATAAGRLRDAKAALLTAEGAATRSLDLSTEAGRKNRTMLDELDAAINAKYGPTAEGYKLKVDTIATAFGMSRDAAILFLQKQNEIPKDFVYDVRAIASVDTASLQQVFKGTSAGGYFSDSMNQKRTVGGTGLAAGGPVLGPGGPRDDAIPIWASAGEYMQPADVVGHYGLGFMEDVRNKKLPKGYASGGPIGLNALGAGTGAAYIATVNAQTMMGLPHPAQLPKYVAPVVVPVVGGNYGGASVDLSGVRGTNRQIVAQVFSQMFGWGSPAELAATEHLLMGESGYNNLAQNRTSTAFGLFQFLDSTWGGYGIGKTADPTQQAIAGGRYIKARYGDPINAFSTWSSRSPHWYDRGGWLNPGDRGENHSSKPEAVLTPRESQAYVSQAKAAASGQGGTFTGTLVLADGSLLGVVKGAIRQIERDSGMF